MTDATFGPVVSTAWLADRLGDPTLRVLDATWYLPHLGRDARAEFREAHIPGAVYFDIDAISDHARGLPHMLPGEAQFAEAVGALGVGDGDRVVVYAGKYLVASARVWWTFRVFGHERVAVLEPARDEPTREAMDRVSQLGVRVRASGRSVDQRRPVRVRVGQSQHVLRDRNLWQIDIGKRAAVDDHGPGY